MLELWKNNAKSLQFPKSVTFVHISQNEIGERRGLRAGGAHDLLAPPGGPIDLLRNDISHSTFRS
jgi:hypothetical protein